MALLITFLLGIFFLAGIIIIKLWKNANIVEQISISIAAGAMIALGVFDLIPEIIENIDGTKNAVISILFVIIGIVILKGLDMLVPEHSTHDHENNTEGEMAHIGFMAAVAIIIHNILEGMTVYNIASTALLSGVSLSIGIGLHNIPMGMLIYAMLKNQNKLYKSTVVLSASFSTFVGGLIMALINPSVEGPLMAPMICITLGMVLFIVLFELIPSILAYKHKKLPVLCLTIGFCLVLISTFME